MSCLFRFNSFMQPPFIGGNRAKIQQKIVKDKIKLPNFLSNEAPSLLKGVSLLEFLLCFPAYQHCMCILCAFLLFLHSTVLC